MGVILVNILSKGGNYAQKENYYSRGIYRQTYQQV